MDFGSKFVFAYESSDESDMSADELEEGMDVSLSDGSEEDDGPGAPSRPAVKKTLKKKRGWRERRDGNQTDSVAPRAPTQIHMAADSTPIAMGAASGVPRGASTNAAPAPAPAQRSANSAPTRVRKADTNVICVKFDTLANPSDTHAGDPTYCGNDSCRAVMSHLAHMEERGEDKVWRCEFCEVENIVELEEEEVPTKKDVTFLLEVAPSAAAAGVQGRDDTLVVFVVDVSGSMCVTMEVPGRVNLRGTQRLDDLQRFNEMREDQFLPGQRRDVTYISRLQGVQAAVDAQLVTMAAEYPDRRAALVTFNNEVTVYGDGSGEPLHISGDKLASQETLLELGAAAGLPGSVKTSRKRLSQNVFELEEGGGTCLGPALLVSIAMAAQKPGSKVIVCTDGKANVGLGSLDNADAEEAMEAAEKFYDDVAIMANEKGVSVSVVSIKGTDCKLVELGKVAQSTYGQVNIVDPLKLTSEFSNILADKVIATNVTATLLLHKGLYFRDEESQQNRVTREVGNVTKTSEVTFEYGVRRDAPAASAASAGGGGGDRLSTVREETESMLVETGGAGAGATGGTSTAGAAAAGGSKSQKKEPEVLGMSELPFQLQIRYRDSEGAESLRVISEKRPVTRNREQAEDGLNFDVMGRNVVQKVSTFAMQGAYTQARTHSMANQRLLSKASRSSEIPSARKQYRHVFQNVQKLDSALNAKQSGERSRSSDWSWNDDHDEVDTASTSLAPAAAPRPAMKALGFFKAGRKHMSKLSQDRHRGMADDEAQIMYDMMNNPSTFLVEKQEGGKGGKTETSAPSPTAVPLPPSSPEVDMEGEEEDEAGAEPSQPRDSGKKRSSFFGSLFRRGSSKE